ncbi:bifunctional diguanylate cyclase/phosphohydrolase [Alicyclobacillus tolerans]|uniref:Diguanylate cyclase (GGDEF) domain-containing protein/HDIG domain-containing protein n=1 Tax=Alicyclobacillus tolerans TaxID=90970 RepID=A0A1M6M2R6_9BACL|nr:diguanylate cyclase [Alicyclobacillus montanus]SHJ77643.1 diguanylate cyclase (GGDEF) domain-containing protein/HDIG domain-containing protein [Alicyclobacillus montanus]
MNLQNSWRYKSIKIYQFIVALTVIAVAIYQLNSIKIPDDLILYSLIGLISLTQMFKIIINEHLGFTWNMTFYLGFSLVYPLKTVLVSGAFMALYTYIINLKNNNKSEKIDEMFNQSIFTLSSTFAVWFTRSLFNAQGSNNLFNYDYVLLCLITYSIVNMLLILICYIIMQGLVGLKIGIKSMLQKSTFSVLVVGGLTAYLLALTIHASGLRGVIIFTILILIVSRVYQEYFKLTNHFKRLSITDELTGLHNHRYIHNWLDKRVADNLPFNVLLVDIDNFRRYNDAHGHLHGDLALSHLGKLFHTTAREGELIARVSGEEFLIIIPDVSVEEATQRAQVYCDAVQHYNFPSTEQYPVTKLTVSIGVARYPDTGEKKHEVLSAADDALYKIKVATHSRVAVFSSIAEDIIRELQGLDVSEKLIDEMQQLMQLMHSRDRYTYRHTERNVKYAAALARKLNLDKDLQKTIRVGAFLHDIGKLKIPVEVIAKSDPLSKEEWDLMRDHPNIGYQLALGLSEVADCLPIIRYHHERYDGTGYPEGKLGAELPLSVRIMTLVDSFDAMTTSRPYRKKRTMEEAFDELDACRGTQFDPDLVEPFKEVVREIGILQSEEPKESAII